MNVLVFGQEKLIPDDQLESFLSHLSWAWIEGMSAKEIAKEMKFGEPEPEGYPQLKTHHVYYFAEKYAEEWEMEPRRKLKKKEPQTEEPKQTEVLSGIPIKNDMPFLVVQYLRNHNLLIE